MVAALSLVVGAFVVLGSNRERTDTGSVEAWTTLGTADVHSLAFDPADAQHLYFGHHAGLLESRDGGRTWSSTSLTGVDAMNVEPGEEGRFQVAGHNVYVESTDGGQTWTPVPNDLPGLDLHAFAVDPANAAHVWTFAVGFGLFESTDAGRRWEPRQSGNWPALAAYREDDSPLVLAISAAGVQRSIDGGRSWETLTSPPGQPITLAVAADGSRLYVATATGVYRSAAGGASWTPTAFKGVALALAVASENPDEIALVDERTALYRSSDGGLTFAGPR